MKNILWVFIVFSLLSISQSIYADKLAFPIPGQTLQNPIDEKIFFKATQMALLQYKWKLLQKTNGEIIAEFVKGKGDSAKTLKIRILYNAENYSFEYIDSKNLNARVIAKDTIDIHKNVEVWIRRLDAQIAINYLNATNKVETNSNGSENDD